jgi:hypothetical protein
MDDPFVVYESIHPRHQISERTVYVRVCHAQRVSDNETIKDTASVEVSANLTNLERRSPIPGPPKVRTISLVDPPLINDRNITNHHQKQALRKQHRWKGH